VRYRCRRCGAAFDYNPTHQENLPRTIEKSGVPDECPRRAAQNHNEGRAAWHQ
jgi:tRNA(Ile2) C34 agmatinyltransferase TiaS